MDRGPDQDKLPWWQEDYRAGRTTLHRNRTLAAKQTRAILIAHPDGLTNEEVRTELGITDLPQRSTHLIWLQQKGWATRERCKLTGRALWFAHGLGLPEV